MPALNAAASPVAIAAPPSPSGNANGISGAGSPDAQGANPFAAVLGRQMKDAHDAAAEAPGAAQAPPGSADSSTAPSAETAVEDLAALLPMLFGIADPAAAGKEGRIAKQDRAEGATEGATEGGNGPGDGAMTQAELALAMLAAPVASAVSAAGATTNPATTASAAQDSASPGLAIAAGNVASLANGARSQPAAASVPAIVAAPTPETAGSPRQERAATPQAAAATAAETFKVEREGMRQDAPKADAGTMGAARDTLPEQAMVPMHAAAAARHAAGDTSYRITPAVGSRQWETAIGNSMVFMTGQQKSSAELVLTPPQLGRIEISLSVNADNTATATFVSASPAVQEALTNAVPRLKEILADAGITLSQADVNAGSPEQSPGQGGGDARRSATADFGGDETGRTIVGTATGMRLARGMVDVFA